MAISLTLLISSEKIVFASLPLLSQRLLEVLQIYAFIKYLNVYFRGWNILPAQSYASRFISSANGG